MVFLGKVARLSGVVAMLFLLDIPVFIVGDMGAGLFADQGKEIGSTRGFGYCVVGFGRDSVVAYLKR
jgi:hypothetical protein